MEERGGGSYVLSGEINARSSISRIMDYSEVEKPSISAMMDRKKAKNIVIYPTLWV